MEDLLQTALESADEAISLDPGSTANAMVFVLVAAAGVLMALVYVPVRLFLTITARSRRLRLLQRIRRRGINAEREIQFDYLERLNRTYTEFFHYYSDAPVLVVNAAEIDFAHNEAHFTALLQQALVMDGMRQYFNAQPTLL